VVELTIRIIATFAQIVSVAWLLRLCSILVDGPLNLGRRGHPDVDAVVVRIYWNKAGLPGVGKIIYVTRKFRFLVADRGIRGDFRYRGVIKVASLSAANALVFKLDF
jgi:hypothetical protein